MNSNFHKVAVIFSWQKLTKENRVIKFCMASSYQKRLRLLKKVSKQSKTALPMQKLSYKIQKKKRQNIQNNRKTNKQKKMITI